MHRARLSTSLAIGPSTQGTGVGQEQTSTLSKGVHQNTGPPLCMAMLAARDDQAMRWNVSDVLQVDLGCLRLSSGLEEDIGLFTAYREKQLKIHVPARIPLTEPLTPDRL